MPITSTAVVVNESRFMDALADENYLAECRKIYPPVFNHPIGYRNVFPGKTSVSEVLKILGDPQKRSNIPDQQEEWAYGSFDKDLYYFIYIKKNATDSIRVVNDANIVRPLKNLLETYGCPDLIVATTKEPDFSVENTSTPSIPTYGVVYFEYITAGLSFGFDSYPLSFSDVPAYVNFVTPEFLKDEYGNVTYPYDFPIELQDVVK